MKLPMNETLLKLNSNIKFQIIELNQIICELKKPVAKAKWYIIDMT